MWLLDLLDVSSRDWAAERSRNVRELWINEVFIKNWKEIVWITANIISDCVASAKLLDSFIEK